MMTSVQRLDFFPKTDSPDTGPAVGRDGETVEMTPQPLPAYNRGNIVLSMDDDDAEDAEDTTSNQAPLTDKTYMEAPEVVHPANSDESRLRANSLSPLRPYSGTSSTRLPDVYEVEGSDDGSRLSLAKDLAR